MKILEMWKNKKKIQEITLTEDEYLEYLNILKDHNEVTLSDRFSSSLRKINPIMFYTPPVIEQVEEILKSDPKFECSQQLALTVKKLSIIKVANIPVTEIIRYNIFKEFATYKRIFGELATIFNNNEKFELLLQQDYLNVLYKVLRYKLYLKE